MSEKDESQYADELRAKLTNAFTPIISSSEHPWMLIVNPTRHIMTSYVRSKESESPIQDVIRELLPVDSATQQQFLEVIKNSSDEFKAFAWKDILPLLIGTPMALGELAEETHAATEGNVTLELSAYRKIIIDVCGVKVFEYVAQKLGISTDHATMLLEARLNRHVGPKTIRSERDTG